MILVFIIYLFYIKIYVQNNGHSNETVMSHMLDTKTFSRILVVISIFITCVIAYSYRKPCPWDIKYFVLCGKGGLPYDFMLYQGSATELSQSNLQKFGFGASVVFHLVSRIKNVGHKLFFDNFFTTYQLLEILQQKKINCIGTVRVKRFANPPLLPDKEMARKDRGNSDEVYSGNCKVVIVKWYDNKPINVASNLVGIGNQKEVTRWDKSNKEFKKFHQPEIIYIYL